MAMESAPDGLVTVFDTERESEAMVVKGLLDANGIDSIVISLDAPQEVLPGVGGVRVQVRPEQAEEARNVISEYRASAASDSEFTEEPTA